MLRFIRNPSDSGRALLSHIGHIYWFLPFSHAVTGGLGGLTLELNSEPGLVDIEDQAWAAPLRGSRHTNLFVEVARPPGRNFCSLGRLFASE